MRVDRVIQESEGSSTITRFHPATTVVHGFAGSSLRFASSLIDAVCGDPDGVHVEVHLAGRELAVFRPEDESHRVIDIEGATDVSDEFENVAGMIDLLVPLRLSRLRAEGAMLVCPDDVEVEAEPRRRRLLSPLALVVALAAVAAGALVASTPAQMGAALAVCVLALVARAVAGRRVSVRSSRADTDAIDGNIAAAQDATGLDDPLPVFLVDVFESLAPADKAAALDAAVRASAGGQVVIVTNDPDVVDLARFREMAGEVSVVTPSSVTEAAA